MMRAQLAAPGLRSSISLASDWSEYVGRNCYPGHGAVGLAEGYELQGSFAVEACKAECEKVSTCAGIVIAQQHVMGQGPCWRLASLTESVRDRSDRMLVKYALQHLAERGSVRIVEKPLQVNQAVLGEFGAFESDEFGTSSFQSQGSEGLFLAGPQHQGCASVGKFKWMLQDPLSLIGADSSDSEGEDGQGNAKKARLEPNETQGHVSFADLQHAGYQPVELLETERYLRDVAGQEERKPCTEGSSAPSAAETEIPTDPEPKDPPAPEPIPQAPAVKLRQDSRAPIPSALETFKDASMVLHSKLMEPLLEMGFEKPTPIQAFSMPIIAAGRDLIGISATGSGKTLAYLLPCFSRLLRATGPTRGRQWPWMLILGPTRELVAQIQKSSERFCRAGDALELEVIYGGGSKQQQLAGLRKKPTILAATPGRLLEFLEEDPPVLTLTQLRALVLDEADRLLGEGFEAQVRLILAQAASPSRQTLLFSATWPVAVQSFSSEVLKDPVEVRVGAMGSLSANPNVAQDVMILRDDGEKPSALAALLRGRRSVRAIVFVATKRGCQQLERSLRGRLPLSVDAIHGDRSQRDREAALQHFRSGAIQVLLATDVAGRGIDVKDVNLVVNYDMPRSAEDYVHRIGRTGRNNKGVAVSILTDNDQDAMSLIAKVIKDSGTRMPPELVKRLGPNGPPAPPTGPSESGGPVDPRMHWLEPWKGLDGNKYDKEDLKSAVESLWS
ncbi:unnamed protein product [Cladocopium goreaui]|uniref:RNA helicase n=1 Tax=Cladocopium goreaui TaxID=2562237 RepID=A0A9P1CA38_9DINO|nr:unnamed protein product [Cladocopium goreaui]